MVLWTVMSSGQPDMLCMSMHDASPLNGMALMYALMSIFHAAPWLKLISNRRSGTRRSITHRLRWTLLAFCRPPAVLQLSGRSCGRVKF
jgi:hypothetical protein